MKARLGLTAGVAALGATTLVAFGSSSATAAAVGCSVTAPTHCVMGTVTITTANQGSGPALPANGWTNTVSSTNCPIPNNPIVTTPSAGGAATSGALWVNAANGDPCQYTVSEAPVDGWMTTYTPNAVVEMSPAGAGFQAMFGVTNTPKQITIVTAPPAPPANPVGIVTRSTTTSTADTSVPQTPQAVGDSQFPVQSASGF